MWIYLLVVILLIVIAIVLYIIFVRPRESAGLSSDNNSQLLDFILEPDPTPAKRVKFEKVIDNSPDIITQLIAYAKLHNLNSARFYSRLNDLYHPKTITSGAGPLVSGAGPELVALRKKILTGLCDAFVLDKFSDIVANDQETLYDAILTVHAPNLEMDKDQFWEMRITIDEYEKKYKTAGADIKKLYEQTKKENDKINYNPNSYVDTLKKRKADEDLEKLKLDYMGYENGTFYANNKAIITAQLADPTSKLITRLKELNETIRLAIKNNELIIKTTSEQYIKDRIRQTYNNTAFVEKVFTSFKALPNVDYIYNTLIGYPTIDHIFMQKDVNLIESLAGCGSAGITLKEIKGSNSNIVKNCEQKYIENFDYKDAFILDLGNTEKSNQTLNYYQVLLDKKVNREECKKKYIAARITELKNDLSSKNYLKELQDTILKQADRGSALRELVNILPTERINLKLEQGPIDREANAIAEKYTAYEMKKILWVIDQNLIGDTQEKITVWVEVSSKFGQNTEKLQMTESPSTDYVYREFLGYTFIRQQRDEPLKILYDLFKKNNADSSAQQRLFIKSKGDQIREELLRRSDYFIQYYDWVKNNITPEWSNHFDTYLAEKALEAEKEKTPNIDIIATWCRANEPLLATSENDIIKELGTKNKDILKSYKIPPSTNDIYESVKALPPYNGDDNALLMAIGNKVKDWMMNQSNGLEVDWLITNKRNSIQQSYIAMYPLSNVLKVAELNNDLINPTMPFIKKIYDDLLKTVMTDNPDAYTIHLGNEVIKKLGNKTSDKYRHASLKFIANPSKLKPQKDAIIAKYKFIFDNRIAVDAEVPIQNTIITNACPSASTDPEKLVCITKEAQFYDTMFKQYNEAAAEKAASATTKATKKATDAGLPAPAPVVPVVLTRNEWLTTLNFVELFELRQIMNQKIRDLDIEMNKIMKDLSWHNITVVMDDTQFKKELEDKLKPIIDTAYSVESDTIKTTFLALSEADKIKQLNKFADEIYSSIKPLLTYELPTTVSAFTDNSIADLTNLYNNITQTKKDAVKKYSDTYGLDDKDKPPPAPVKIKKLPGMNPPSNEWSTAAPGALLPLARGVAPTTAMFMVPYLQASIDMLMKNGLLPAVATKNNYEQALTKLQDLFYEAHKRSQIISLRSFLKDNAAGPNDLFKALIYYITSNAAPAAITKVLEEYLKPAGRLNADGSPIFTSDTNIGQITDKIQGKMQDLANGLATTKYETLNRSLEALINPPAAPDIASAIANAKKAQDTIKTAIKTVDIAVKSADASYLKVAASADAAAKITANTAKIAANTAKTAMTTAQGSADAAVIAASAAGITLDNANIEAKKAEDAAKAALMELTKAVDAASTAAAEVAKIAAPAAAVPAAGPAPLTAAAAIVDATTAEETATEAFAVITAALETADAAVKSAENIERKFPAGTTAHTAVVANTTAAKTAKGLVDNIKRVAKAANDSVKAQVITAKDPATLVPNAIAAANTAKTDAKTVLTEASKAAKAAKDAVDAAAHAAVVPTPVLAAPAPIIIHEEEEPTIIYKDVYTPLDHKLLNTTDPDDTIKIMYRNLRERNPHFPTTTNVGKMTSYLNNWLDEGKSNSSPKDFIKNYVNYRHSTKKPVNLINIDDTYEQNQKKLLS